MQPTPASSIEPAEIARFDALAAAWWDPDGPMRPLHRMNPARVGWILDHARARFGALEGLRVLDTGCGAGLAAEAMAEAGCSVLGIDGAPDVIAAAAAHAAETGTAVRYRVAAAEDLAEEPERFPLVTALEVVEHVAEPESFIRTLAGLVAPGGLLVMSTLDRSVASYLAAKVGAEYLLRWLPVGTHEWNKFLRPAELATLLRRAGMRPFAVNGMAPSLDGGWRIVAKPGVNYIVAAER
jgi:2-polyprenyl-6-hydroxyphenyl methylase/3-demethylubiquinone-9 3-methyltransferase